MTGEKPRRLTMEWAARICQSVLRGRYARRRVAKMLDEKDRETRKYASHRRRRRKIERKDMALDRHVRRHQENGDGFIQAAGGRQNVPSHEPAPQEEVAATAAGLRKWAVCSAGAGQHASEVAELLDELKADTMRHHAQKPCSMNDMQVTRAELEAYEKLATASAEVTAGYRWSVASQPELAPWFESRF